MIDSGEKTWCERDRQNQIRMLVWCFAWMAAVLTASLLLRSELVPSGAMALTVALVPSALGVATVWNFKKFLNEADELLRKIQLEALALGFAGGIVVAMGYRLLERAGAPPADVGDMPVPMSVFYIIGIWLSRRRYA